MPRRLKLALLTSMGLGWLRPAPGTWGSLPPVALALTLVAFGGGELTRGGIAPVNALLVLLALLAGWICLAFGDWAEKQFGRKDASEIVIDEVAGQSSARLFLPWRAVSMSSDSSLSRNPGAGKPAPCALKPP